MEHLCVVHEFMCVMLIECSTDACVPEWILKLLQREAGDRDEEGRPERLPER